MAPDATAFAARRDQWDIDILTQWVDAADADSHIASARAFWDAIAPHSAGVYVNHLDADDATRGAHAPRHDGGVVTGAGAEVQHTTASGERQ